MAPRPEYQHLYFQQKGQEPSPGPSTALVDDYRSPPSVESLSSNGSPSFDSGGGESSDDGDTLTLPLYNLQADEDLAATFTSKCQTIPSNNIQAMNAQQLTDRYCEPPYTPVVTTSFPSSVFSPSATYYDLMHITVNLEAGFCFPLALT